MMEGWVWYWVKRLYWGEGALRRVRVGHRLDPRRKS